ncbi:OGT [Symbiodinium natans]|uniref:OGT protein n=1 Tax=Symbiodinium natans TaxID=878477 RepID=A0A812Q0E0_9DINO|nr:OGT [Symbiodinium natans]
MALTHGISEDLLRVDNPDEVEAMSPSDRESIFCFVESWWFHLVAASVICSNTVSIVLEADSEDLVKKLYWLDQATLLFYVLELLCRVGLWKCRLLCGPRHLLLWSLLDLIVVGAGVLDQWLAPILPVDTGSWSNLLGVIRLLRLTRVFKVVGFVLEWDLSFTEQPTFQSFIGGVIAFNALLMGFETDYEWGGWAVIENFLLCIYVFELVVRMKRLGCFFFSCDSPDLVWNLLDLAIVVSSAGDSWLVPLVNVARKSFQGDQSTRRSSKAAHGVNVGQLMMLMRLLRLLRILRLAKLVKSVRPLYILVVSVTAAVQGVVWVLVLTVVTLYAMGILTTRLIGHKMIFEAGEEVDEALILPFKTVPDSMFTLFRVMSGAQSDSESAALDSIMDNIPTFKFAFVFFMVTSSWTLLSILTAVVSENMISTTSSQEKEIQLMSEEEDRKRHIEDLKELFKEINTRGDGIVREKDLMHFLSIPDNAYETAKMCRVPVRHVTEVMKTLSINQQVIHMEEFVECLLDVGNPVTEKSTMRLEALHLETRTQSLRNCQILEDICTSLKSNKDRIVDGGEDQISKLMQSTMHHGEAIARLQHSVEDLSRKMDNMTEMLAKTAGREFGLKRIH